MCALRRHQGGRSQPRTKPQRSLRPNELGKSTLLQAIRVALLLPHSSTRHRPFVDWHDDRPPRVTLTFETEEQRIWRVQKSFGAGADGSSLLEFSRDGLSFSLDCKGREVDGKLRELLSWGAGSPGGSKARAAGCPTPFSAPLCLDHRMKFQQFSTRGWKATSTNRAKTSSRALSKQSRKARVQKRSRESSGES